MRVTVLSLLLLLLLLRMRLCAPLPGGSRRHMLPLLRRPTHLHFSYSDSYTTATTRYGDMLADMSHQLKRVSGAEGLFVVLDVETGRSACALGLATVGFLDPAFAGPDVKRRVYAAKYGVARDLAARGVSQLFLEMDVWLVRDVAPLVSPAHDITMSMHQDNPFEMNVGFYFMRANARTVAFMDATANYLDKYVLLLPSPPPPIFPCCAAAPTAGSTTTTPTPPLGNRDSIPPPPLLAHPLPSSAGTTAKRSTRRSSTAL